MVAELSLRIAGGPDAPATARDALRRFHSELPAELMQLVTLLTSELITNAVRHADASSIGLACQLSGRTIRVEVSDEGPGFAPARPPRAEAGGRSGWGLQIVDELADRWGVSGRDGTQVWFEIDR